jgi:hypothetical protein
VWGTSTADRTGQDASVNREWVAQYGTGGLLCIVVANDFKGKSTGGVAEIPHHILNGTLDRKRVRPTWFWVDGRSLGYNPLRYAFSE